MQVHSMLWDELRAKAAFEPVADTLADMAKAEGLGPWIVKSIAGTGVETADPTDCSLHTREWSPQDRFFMVSPATLNAFGTGGVGKADVNSMNLEPGNCECMLDLQFILGPPSSLHIVRTFVPPVHLSVA